MGDAAIGGSAISTVVESRRALVRALAFPRAPDHGKCRGAGAPPFERAHHDAPQECR